MAAEYVLEIDSFKSVDEAKKYAKKYINQHADKTINIVSRDITVIELNEV